MEAYRKIVNIEALTSIDMALHQILPAAIRYTNVLGDTLLKKKELGINSHTEKELITRLSDASDQLYDHCELLRKELSAVPSGNEDIMRYYHEVIIVRMDKLRQQADILEQLTDRSCWPYPTYSDLLFY